MNDDVQQHINGFWSTVAPQYEAHGGNVPARDSAEYAAWVDAIRDLLPPPPADVLDIATGTGFVALIAAALGHRVTGIDASDPMLEEARREAASRDLNLTLELDDAVAPARPEANFDALISRHFIWTLREPDRALRNWLRLLRPGGRAIAIDGFWFASPDDDPGDADPGLFEQHYTRETREALPAMQAHSVEPIVAMFKTAGFVDITVGDLARVHAVAEDPPGTEPWYVITARRGG